MFLNFFSDPASWEVVASGLAEGNVSSEVGPNGQPALRLDYDFHDGGGFVVVRKKIQFALPETFEISFQTRGAGLKNHFEFKLADPGATNAWRYLQNDFDAPADWTLCKIRERDFPFAWGPAGGGAPAIVGAVELVIAAGPGGSGSISFSDISLEDQTLYQPKKITASSSRPNSLPSSVFDKASPSGWQAAETDLQPRWSVDFGRLVRFGGMVIGWPTQSATRSYEVEISRTGKSWSRIYSTTQDRGHRSHIPAPYAEARYLRINFANADSAALLSLDLRPDAFSHTPNEFIHAVAEDFPCGWFPAYWYRRQSYWTPVGSPEGRRRALINEEGMVEVDEAEFSLEPFLLVADRLVTWADVEIHQSFPDNGAPFPVVTWQMDGLKLTVMPWVDGEGDELVLRVTYQVETTIEHEVRLAVAVRPFQVNPPWQAFRNLGGRSPIHKIKCDAKGMTVDQRRVDADRAPQSCGAASFDEGGVVAFLATGDFPPRDEVHDETGLASAVMAWCIPRRASSFRVTISVPYFQKSCKPAKAAREMAIAHWNEVLAPVEWRVPACASSAISCFRTAAAHILINRDGPAIQPGPRRYTRSWVRDCVIMGAALTKAGHSQALRDFLLWYAQFQRDDGYVPAVVDRDGVDNLVEHDSHGQFLWGIREVHRTNADPEFLSKLWESVRGAAEFLLRIRSQRLTPELREPERSATYGLVPESASHEGYLAHPVHSYWDNFWGIRGLEAAAELALAMGFPQDAQRWHAEASAFLKDVILSIEKIITDSGLAYIPGSVEWADFDPTATANAIAQLDFADNLPSGPLHQMLDTYLQGFRRKHGGEIPWLNYTAYEIRIIGAFVRLGRRDEAHELLDFFLSDQRPVEWNQWPEITWRDPRSPGHLGDVPHTWIAAEYMLALVSMVASEREGTAELVLAPGLPWSWISEDKGFSVRGLTIRYGKLDFKIRAHHDHRVTVQIGGGICVAPGGISILPPLPHGLRIISAVDSDGEPLEIHNQGTCVSVTSLPLSATLFLGQ